MLTGFSILALLAYSNAQSGVETYSSINPPSPIACRYSLKDPQGVALFSHDYYPFSQIYLDFGVRDTN